MPINGESARRGGRIGGLPDQRPAAGRGDRDRTVLGGHRDDGDVAVDGTGGLGSGDAGAAGDR